MTKSQIKEIQIPLVSIIIPTFNEETVIGSCLKSLTAQSYKKSEIIIVDDGSRDQTTQEVQKFNVRLLTQKHLGPGPARNRGAKVAQGEILVFVDADMTFAPDFIENITLPIRQGKSKGTFSRDEIVENWENVWARCWNWNNASPDRLRIRNNIHDQEDFRAILRSEFSKVGGFDSTGYTDSRTLVKKLRYLPTAITGAKYYHRNPASLSEIYAQARWIGRRKMRLGAVGQVLNLARFSLPVSLLFGLQIAVSKGEISFILFKLIFDAGFVTGILSNIFQNQTAR